MPVSVTVRYFAVLREKRGLGEERIETESTTARALYASLAQAHGLLPDHIVRFGVDGAIVADAPLRDGLVLNLIPPVGGG